MSDIPQDWRKKIIVEQIRVSSSLGRMDETKSLLIQLEQLEPENESIKKELDRLQRGVRLQIVTDSSENPYECHLAYSEESARALEARAQQANNAAPIPKARFVAEPTPQRITTKVIKFKEPTKHIHEQHHELSEEEKLKEHVNKMVQLYKTTPDYVRRLTRTKIRKHQRFLDSCIKDTPYAWSIAERESISHILNLLNLDLKRRNREKAVIISVCSLLVVFGIIALCACMMLDSAKRADIKVQYALVHEDKAELIYQIEEADRPIYFLLYPQLEHSMEQARQWLSKLDQSHELIIQIEEGSRDINKLSQEELQSLRNLEEATDQKSIQLVQRLTKFKAQKLSQQEQNKLQLLNEIAKAVPAESPLSGNLATDEQRLQDESKSLAKAIELFNNTKSQHGKNDSYMAKSVKRQKEIQSMIQAMDKLELTVKAIDKCNDYQKHVDLLRKLNSNIYPLAQELSTIAEHLPALDEINKMMRYGSDLENQVVLQKAERIFLDDLPNFSTENPATAQQIDTMEQIFRSRAFYLPLYQVVSSYTGKVWLSESLPTLEDDGSMSLTVSKLDPSAKLTDDRKIKIAASPGLVLHQFNTTGIIKAVNLSRNTFFAKAKILDDLTTILQYQDEKCPILAQAYIYQQFIKLIELHPKPALMGLSFSEQLRDDIKSFKASIAKAGIQLDSQNWLLINHGNKQAEAIMTEWFKQHRHHNYSMDCKKRLRDILFTEVRYAGYVNGKGQAVLHKNLKQSTSVWYLDKESKKICVGTLKQIPQAIPYSPLLYSASK